MGTFCNYCWWTPPTRQSRFCGRDTPIIHLYQKIGTLKSFAELIFAIASFCNIFAGLFFMNLSKIAKNSLAKINSARINPAKINHFRVNFADFTVGQSLERGYSLKICRQNRPNHRQCFRVLKVDHPAYCILYSENVTYGTFCHVRDKVLCKCAFCNLNFRK